MITATVRLPHDKTLRDAGWAMTRSGRYVHPDFPGEAGRRKLFTEGQALTLTDADPKEEAC